ncbi:MAG: cobalamin biosynthesis protein CobQ [Desulfurococcales archaeon ex4484_58]|nr:MAG: cobalamin biosynthesis protein CobQ [Desulfurococcales archaeon ex4484_58]
MFRVTVTGGKGGTGKSFVAVNLAIALTRYYEVVLADVDVEAPNDYVLLGINKLENEEPIKVFLPFIDTGKCTRCGVCAKVCDTGAILMPPNAYPVIFPRLCSGCKACYYGCPYNAIIKGYHVLGYTYYNKLLYNNKTLHLVTGVLREGEEHTPPAVLATRKRAENINGDILILDTGAGTGNQISLSLQNTNLVIAVTEPTPLGLHDLLSILEVVKGMNLGVWVVINKYGVGDPSRHLEILEKYGVEKIYRIPFNRDVVETYIYGKPIVLAKPSSIVSKTIYDLSIDLVKVIGGG